MRRYWILFGSLFLLIPSIILLAQNEDCPALVEQALAEVGDNCEGLQRNSACYGYNQVEASFAMEVAEDFFTTPSDRAELTTLQTIRTAPLNLDNKQWGIALLSVQANVPNTLPGQAVVFMLLGDVEMRNTVAPEEAFTPADGVTVKTAVAANFRSGPSTNNNVLNNVPPGTELLGDGLSPDKGWLRVVFEGKVGWLSREVLQPTDELDALPIIRADNHTPMQAFYFTTGIGEPTCNEPPSSLVIQGPRQTKVTFNANGTDFTIGSTIILRQIGPNEMQLIVVDGTAEFAGLTVGGGFTIFFNTDDEGNIIQNSFNGFRPITPKEIEQFKLLEELDFSDDEGEDKTLNYPIRLPTQEEITIIQQALSGGGGTVGNATSSQVAGVNCNNLRPTSPIGGMPFGPTTFYWDGASGADRYRVNVYGQSGLAGSFETSDASTSLNIDTSSFGGGPDFSWQVQALKGGVIACTSGAAFAKQDPPPSDAFASGKSEGPKISASWGCGASMYEIDVSWSGFKDNETIIISFSDLYGTPYTQTHMGSAGTTTFYGVYYSVGPLTVQGSISGTVTRPGGFVC